MLKERILKVDLETMIELFRDIKWKFFEDNREGESADFDSVGVIKIEHPVSADEVFIVKLTYINLADLQRVKSRLVKAGFIEQEIRTVAY